MVRFASVLCNQSKAVKLVRGRTTRANTSTWLLSMAGSLSHSLERSRTMVLNAARMSRMISSVKST